MKNPLFSLPKALGLHTIVTFLVGIGCVYPLSLSLELTAPVSLGVGCCLLVALLFAAFDCVPRLRALAYPALFLGIAALAIRYAGQASAISAALVLMVNGQTLALMAYSRAIVVLLSLLFTGVGASLARSDQAFFPLALLTIALLFVISFLGANVSATSLLPLVLALLISGRAQGVHTLRIVPCAALVLALTALCMPLAGKTVPEFADAAKKLRQAIGDYLFFTDPRTAFSLSTTGWQPLGVNRLGGPVSPQDTPVMQVRTSGRTLLRGAIKNYYSGSAWMDTTSGRRYLYINPRFSSLRRNLFDLSRPEDDIRTLFPEEETITVLMRADSASTLYLTQRFEAPSGPGIVPYFSPASEVFGTRSLSQGDSYTFTGSRLTADSPQVREAVLTAMQNDDPYYETVQSAYLQLPDLVEPEVFALAQQITDGLDNAFDRAFALYRYLQIQYPYTLEQSEPPMARDFVSWFLLSEQKGYCTSFASALAVMARCIGIPARYIEGYAADPDVDGVARVTQQDAHAWAELYFPGFGWLTFDPTPSAGGGTSSPEVGSDTQPPQPSTTPPDSTPEPSPTPSAPPTTPPEATPTPPDATPASEAQTPTPTPAPSQTPTPAPSSAPSPSPTPNPGQTEDQPSSALPILWALLIVLLLLAAAALRLMLCAPARLAAQNRNAGDALMVWYHAIEEALLCMGIRAAPGEAPATFLLRAQQALGNRVKLTTLGKALCIVRYSPYKLNRTQPERAQKTYLALLGIMRLPQKAHLYARRLIYGSAPKQ